MIYPSKGQVSYSVLRLSYTIFRAVGQLKALRVNGFRLLSYMSYTLFRERELYTEKNLIGCM